MSTLITVNANLPAGTYVLTPQSTTPPVTPPAPPPAAGVPALDFIIYQNGKMYWSGFWSFGVASVNPSDGAGGPMGGGADIAVVLATPFGGILPYNVAANFDTSKYGSFVFSAKPTVDGAIFATSFDSSNDTPDGPAGGIVVASPTTTLYGPATKKGVWGTYRVPLKVFGLTSPVILKMSIADGAGLPAGTGWFVDNIGFTIA